MLVRRACPHNKKVTALSDIARKSLIPLGNGLLCQVLPGQHVSVLCVDDNSGVLNFLKAAFAASAYNVETAQNGSVALQKLSKDPNRFQVIVTDLRMPRLDGFGLIEQSRANGYAGPFVIYAASIDPNDRQRLSELGVRRVIDKPASAGELIAAVKEVQTGF